MGFGPIWYTLVNFFLPYNAAEVNQLGKILILIMG